MSNDRILYKDVNLVDRVVSDALPLPTKVIGSTTPTTLPTTSPYTQGNVSFSSSGENVVVSGTASQTTRVFALFLTFDSAVNVTIKDAAGGNTLGVYNGIRSLVMDPFVNDAPRFITAVAGAFVISLSAAVVTVGSIWYAKGVP